MTIQEWEEYNEGKPLREWAKIPEEVDCICVVENNIVLMDEARYNELICDPYEYIKKLKKELDGYKDWVKELQDVIEQGHKPVNKQAKKVEKCAQKLITELSMLKAISQ